MKKPIIALLLVFAMLLPLPAVAKVGEGMKNGSFEILKADGSPESWYCNEGTFGKEFSLVNENPQDGKQALKMVSSGAIYASAAATGLKGGTDYVFSVYMRQAAGVRSAVKLECMYTENGKTQYIAGPGQLDINEEAKEWKKQEIKFTLPALATGVTVLLRKFSAGEVLWDTASLQGEVAETATPVAQTSAPAVKPPTMTLGGENVELVKNGSFETLKADGAPENWYFNDGTTFGGAFSLETKGAKTGTNALKISGSDAEAWASTAITGLVGGTDYVFSAYLRQAGGTNSAIKMECMYTADGKTQYISGPGQVDMKDACADWTKQTFQFTLPAQATSIALLVRKFGAGEAFWDDISLIGKRATTAAAPQTPQTTPTPEVLEIPAPLAGATDIFINGGFEEGENGGATDWRADYNTWTGAVSITEENPHGGSRALKITTDKDDLPSAGMLLKDVVPGAEYVVNGWYKSDIYYGTGALKMEYYDINDIKAGHGTGSGTSEHLAKNTNGAWKQFSQVFKTPEETKSVAIYPRLYGKGVIYYDDLECYQIQPARYLYLSTDNFFYYSDWERGTATARAHSYYDSLVGGTVDFALKDGNSIIAEQRGVPLTDYVATYAFDLFLMTKKGHIYTMEATVRDNTGAAKETQTEPICRYDRPNFLGADGFYKEDGVILDPIFMDHARVDDYEKLAEIRINMAQDYSTANSTKMSITERAAYAAEHNIKLMLPLYAGNMKPAGHPDNVKGTTDTVTAVRDSAGVYCYMTMDEPYNNDPYPEENLRNSYMLLRNLDQNHPVFTMENFYENYEKVAKFTDVLGIDPYPQGKKVPTTYISECMNIAYDAVRYQKPVICLLQAFDYGNYFPTQDELRNMVYQAFFDGAYGIGYYCFEKSKGELNLDETVLWDTLKQMNATEVPDAFQYFVHKSYKTFCSGTVGEVRYRSFIKDGKVQLIALNSSATEARSADIPLLSDVGSVQIGGFAATATAGGGKDSTGTGTLHVELAPAQVAVYTITPDTATDFSVLPTGRFIDLENHTWARDAIENLADRGFVNWSLNGFYRPGEKITRADFAMFLVRTLGLTADTTENFADVNPEVYYAKDLAVGRALGLLKGVGENRYNPLAEISRQDMMTIVARGMALSGSADISAFSDHASIADYALPHVQAMLAAGLIQGNADGTINPLGNTTRAEAAVIMQRILNR